eukprot:CAMPEP_0174707686 /NCGR_PEP_ID=MMETSP1094-20130205/10132_1 /TAXON_ID=156173 /ORGANISM="Chrysochromulina brevifilum, Strain UTEX LB 985" /LENGTH=95 /DNA_ID=CAMNT_0015906105 /DNA_START=422 /DNA_END=709 /DNA_ORIENTATION=-
MDDSEPHKEQQQECEVEKNWEVMRKATEDIVILQLREAIFSFAVYGDVKEEELGLGGGGASLVDDRHRSNEGTRPDSVEHQEVHFVQVFINQRVV